MSAGHTSARSDGAPEPGGPPTPAPTRPVTTTRVVSGRAPSPGSAADPPPAAVVRIAERPTLALVLTFAVGVFLGVAIVKPWGSTTAPATDSANGSLRPDTSSLISSAGPEASVDAMPVAATSCLSSDRQQLIVFERWPGNEVRSWIAVPDIAATGPLDQRLVSTDVFAAHATAIGVCAASVGSARTERHAATILDVQVVLANAPGDAPVDAGAPQEVGGGGVGPDPIRLFGPPAAAIASRDAAGPRASAGTSSGAPSARATKPSPSAPRVSPTANGSAGGTALPDTWSLGAYTIGFRFSFDPPDTQRWLRFALLHGGGNG
jgi:hypothetical protein